MPPPWNRGKNPGGPPQWDGTDPALRGPKRTGPIRAIVPGDDVEVAREIARLWDKVKTMQIGEEEDPVNVRKHLSTGSSVDSINVKATPGNVHGWFLSNQNAAVRYVKLYDKATAPTVGTDTPVMTIAIPGGASANVDFTKGIAFTLGIGFGITTAVADNSTASVAANEIVVNLLYL